MAMTARETAIAARRPTLFDPRFDKLLGVPGPEISTHIPHIFGMHVITANSSNRFCYNDLY